MQALTPRAAQLLAAAIALRVIPPSKRKSTRVIPPSLRAAGEAQIPKLEYQRTQRRAPRRHVSWSTRASPGPTVTSEHRYRLPLIVTRLGCPDGVPSTRLITFLAAPHPTPRTRTFVMWELPTACLGTKYPSGQDFTGTLT